MSNIVDQSLGVGIDRITFTITHDYIEKKGDITTLTHNNIPVKEIWTDHIGKLYSNNLNHKIDGYVTGIRDPILKGGKDATDYVLSLQVKFQYPYEVTGYMNPYYLYRHEKQMYKDNAFHGINYLPSSFGKERTKICANMFLKYRDWAIQRALDVWFEEFGLTVKRENVYFKVSSVEITDEYQAHVRSFGKMLRRAKGRRGGAKFNDLTNTQYINDFGKNIQYKIYQKTTDIARNEWTFLNDYAEAIMKFTNWREFNNIIKGYLAIGQKKLGWDFSQIEELNDEDFIYYLAKRWRLERPEVHTLLTSHSFMSSKHLSQWIEKLKRKKLIEKTDIRGKYVPSYELMIEQAKYDTAAKISYRNHGAEILNKELTTRSET